MRIKEEIKRSGDFWLPSFPENKVNGTLSISDGGDITLELTQSFDPSIKAQLSPTHPDSLNPILGHVKKYGYVMIDRCNRTKKGASIIQGRLIAPEVIWADRILTHLPYDENLDLRFNTFTFSVEGLDEWVDITGIEVDEQIEKDALTISYNQPESISINLENGMQLLITFYWTPPEFPRTKRAEVSQKTYFRLNSADPIELDKFIAVAQKITAFLCFIVNEIVCIESVSATSNNLSQTYPDGHTQSIPVNIFYRSWPYAKDEPQINQYDMMFKFEKIQDNAERIISNWIENYEKITPAFDLYFLTKTGTLPSLNLQFLTLVQALEVFHRRTSGGKLSLGNRLEKMTEPFGNFMGGERRTGLIGKIVITRNYLTHGDSKLESKVAKGELLLRICRKMNALFRLQFLKLIGFDEQEINAIVDECPFLKGECNL